MLRRFVLLFIVLGFAMTACGGDDDEDGADSKVQNSSAIDATPTLSFSVELVLWHPYVDHQADALTSAVEAFNDEYAGSISISLEYHAPDSIKSDYEAAIRSGDGPDILVAEYQWLSEFVERRLIYPIDDSVVDIIQSDMPVTVFQSFFYQNQVVAAPLWADMLVLYTNSALVDDVPMTIDDLLDAAEAQPFVLYPGIEGTAGLYNDSTDSFVVSLDGELILFQQNFVSYLTTYRRLLRAEGITFSDDLTQFMNGEVAGIVGFASDYQQLQDALGDDLQVSVLPLNNQAYWKTFSHLTPLVISQNAPESNITAANLFFAYLLTPNVNVQMATRANRIPLVVSSDTELNDVSRIGYQQLQWAHSMSPYPIFYDTILPELSTSLDEVTASSTDSDLEMLTDQFFDAIQE